MVFHNPRGRRYHKTHIFCSGVVEGAGACRADQRCFCPFLNSMEKSSYLPYNAIICTERKDFQKWGKFAFRGSKLDSKGLCLTLHIAVRWELTAGTRPIREITQTPTRSILTWN